MKMLKVPARTRDQLWSGVKPLLKSPFALAALSFARRNPKTAIAMGLATAAGAVLAKIVSSSSKKSEVKSRHRIREADGKAGRPTPIRSNGGVAATQ